MTENITVFTQNSIRIASEAGVIYIDPFQMKDEPHDADFIFITHDHHDHFSPVDIDKAAKPDSLLIIPEGMAGKAGKYKAETVSPGESRNINGLEFETVPAYNNLKPFHPKRNGWVGYIFVTDGKRIYVAGDTDMNADNKKVKCDVALVPIGGTYTMDASEAAKLVGTIRPETAIPTHYGSLVGKKDDADRFAAMVKPPVKVEIKMLY